MIAPFKDLLVIELASVLAGPAVGMFFAELGARVVKIENKTTGGDVTRQWKTRNEDSSDPLSAYYHAVNWGKESILLDVYDSTDKDQVYDWIKQADIVVTNFKKGSAAKLGMDYKTLNEVNDQLIYAAVTAYGENDSRPGFDSIIQADTGWISMNGPRGGMPLKMPVALMDILAAHQLKEGILISLIQRMKTGKGCKVSVSLFDSGVSALTNQASNYLNLGIVPTPAGSQHPNIAPYGEICLTADQVPIMLAIGTDLQFKNLCSLLELKSILEDSRFQNNSQRLVHREELTHLLSDAFATKEAAYLLDEAKKVKVPLAPIKNLQQVFDMPQAQKLILEQKHDEDRISKRVRTTIFSITS